MSARLLPTIALLATLASGAATAAADESLRLRALLIQAEDERDPEAAVFGPALAHADPILRARALRAMGRIGSPGHVSVVARRLTDPDADVRQEAAHALGEIESPAALDSLRRALLTDQPALAGLAAEALAKIDWQDDAARRLAGGCVVSALLAADARSPAARPEARRRALLTAWRFGRETPGLVDALLALAGRPELLRADEAEALVYCAARLREPRLRGVLLEAARHSPTAFGRSQAARGLGTLAADDAAAQREPDLEARELLIELARSTRPWSSAVRVSEKDEGLVLQVNSRPATGVRVAALRALGSFPAPEGAAATAPIAPALSGADAQVTRTAIGLARRWKVEQARPLLRGLVTLEGQVDLQADALEALVELEGRAALPLVERFAGASDWRLRAAAARALGGNLRLGSVGAGARLLEALLLDEDARVVAPAVSAASESGRADAAVLVLAQLESHDPVVRAVAAASLPAFAAGTFDQDEAEAALRALARATDPQLGESSREAALGVLIALLGEEFREELTSARDEGRLDVERVTPLVARRLDRLVLPEEEVAETLRAVLDDAAGEVPADARLVALEALVELLGERAAPDLAAAFRDPEFTVRLAAARLAAEAGLERLARTPVGPVGLGRGLAFYLEAAREEAAAGIHRLHLVTERGLVDLELFPAEAVLTVLRIEELARSGYFDGLGFHRVVPDFVVQGGDPRGDGWGGPERSLRCEINRLRYERGRVGMALSGKDTGGSQFFVTLSPQPHLDGGYTIFGQVTPDSLPVVDALRQHDRILAAVTEDRLGRPGGDS